MDIPESFKKWAFRERRQLIERMLKGESSREDFLVGFLRHTPAIVSCGPAGLNASIKGIGFVVKERYLEETTERLISYIKGKKWNMREAAELLLNEVYVEEKIDFTLLSTVELARRHTYMNIKRNRFATILFFMPPSTSYEVRCEVKLYEDGIYHRYVNAVHDVFHFPGHRDWSKTPVYIFKIREIYDNDPEKMGEKIYG